LNALLTAFLNVFQPLSLFLSFFILFSSIETLSDGGGENVRAKKTHKNIVPDKQSITLCQSNLLNISFEHKANVAIPNPDPPTARPVANDILLSNQSVTIVTCGKNIKPKPIPTPRPNVIV